MNEDKSSYRFDSIDLAIYIWKKRIPLLIITFAAGVISIIGSLMITPRYKSTVVMFPTSEASTSKSLLQMNYQLDFQAVGEEEQVEAVMQVLKSDKIRDKIIEKYNLMEHYGIKPTGMYPMYKLHSFYEANIRVKRTEFNSIVISVMDPDPKQAADMANDIACLADTTIWEMKVTRARKAVELLELVLDSIESELNDLKNEIHTYNAQGIIYFELQIDRLIEAYGKAILENNTRAKKEIEKEILELGNYSSELYTAVEKFDVELERYSDTKNLYLQVKAEYENRLPTVFILDKAFEADKKAYPKKSVIVIIATLSTFILAVLLFLFFENFMKRIKSA